MCLLLLFLCAPAATHVVKVGPLLGSSGACKLTSANPDYELKSYTSCTGWDSSELQFAFTVNGDCSIQISPISDPSCSDPTTDGNGDQYGAVQQRAYYFQDKNGDWKIRSLFKKNGNTK